MSIFSDKIMMQVLGRYIPDGETLEAGICGVVDESYITHVYKQCILDGKNLVKSDEDTGTCLQVIKSKVCTYNVYLGITQHYLILSECEPCEYYYEYNTVESQDMHNTENMQEPGMTDRVEILDNTSMENLGKCFPLSELQSCKFKKIWMGALKGKITFKNGSYFKIMLPKRGGLAGGMPNHEKNRDTIMAVLNRGELL